MKLPLLDGIIDRRILINYRIRPREVKALLPPGVEPLVVNGYASGGICLLRLKKIGVKGMPSLLRIESENAAHRFLVKLKFPDGERPGVYIPRRDTDSILNEWVAGKMFSWPHSRATFSVYEEKGSYGVVVQRPDQQPILRVEAELADSFPPDSMFGSVEHASRCFEECEVGISPSAVGAKMKVITLKTHSWSVRPLQVKELQSTLFDDRSLFPMGTVRFDNALLMENIAHEWRPGGDYLF